MDRFEDGETDGIRIPDNSVRKTPRCRSINANGKDPLERRKSRRHSTGTTPNSANTKCYSPRSPMTLHQTLDEDSSSSNNSGEINDVFGVNKVGYENAGVTPGLRRRRERAERQKSFLREQQEAAAAGLRPFDIKDDIINSHGKLFQIKKTTINCVHFYAEMCNLIYLLHVEIAFFLSLFRFYFCVCLFVCVFFPPY